jgi:hypothetical protein
MGTFVKKRNIFEVSMSTMQQIKKYTTFEDLKRAKTLPFADSNNIDSQAEIKAFINKLRFATRSKPSLSNVNGRS